MSIFLRTSLVFAAVLASAVANSAPVTYALDPNHTFPSFDADHFGGLSVWRGKFRTTSGSVVLDKEAKTGEVTLKINRFLCKINPMLLKEVCGADAEATINRADFGVSYGQAYGFDMSVILRIQVEGIRQ